jgi:hypothetical protein
MLHKINDLTDEFLRLVKDDPVRPEIPVEQRVNEHSKIYVLQNEQGSPVAVTCVKFLSDIPKTVEDLTDLAVNSTTAVFYTIWSYAAGAGKDLIIAAQKDIQETLPEVTTFVTLSPKTEMARRFHHKNGATTFRENADTVNYLYENK